MLSVVIVMVVFVVMGFQPWTTFCEAVANMVNNTLLPPDGKGVLVALRPVPGIRVEQALTLCRPNRAGDIVTIGDNRLLMFLSFCRVNDLDTALNHIFPLPTLPIAARRPFVCYARAAVRHRIKISTRQPAPSATCLITWPNWASPNS